MSGAITVRTYGTKDVLENLLNLAHQYPKEFGKALYREAVPIFRASQKLVPFQFGVLQRSGAIAPPQDHGDGVTVLIYYGTQYALAQHENTTWQHKEGRTAKYLESPFLAAIPGMGARIAEQTMKNIEKTNKGAKK